MKEQHYNSINLSGKIEIGNGDEMLMELKGGK
jgi:hypothetical protein